MSSTGRPSIVWEKKISKLLWWSLHHFFPVPLAALLAGPSRASLSFEFEKERALPPPPLLRAPFFSELLPRSGIALGVSSALASSESSLDVSQGSKREEKERETKGSDSAAE